MNFYLLFFFLILNCAYFFVDSTPVHLNRNIIIIIGLCAVSIIAFRSNRKSNEEKQEKNEFLWVFVLWLFFFFFVGVNMLKFCWRCKYGAHLDMERVMSRLIWDCVELGENECLELEFLGWILMIFWELRIGKF